MSLADDIKSIVQSSLTAFDGIQLTYDYIDADGSARVYDPVSGAYTGGPVTYSAVPMIITGYAEKDADGTTIRKNDKKALIAALDIAITPAVEDVVVLSDGNWKVQDARIDPAGAMWTLRVRR